MTKKVLVIILITIGGLFLLYKLADMFSPGSYEHAETYDLDYPEEKVIEVINQLKTDNPNIAGPNFLKDERISGNWHKVYFYLQEENKIAYTLTRPSGKNKTTFSFVSLNDGLVLGNWKNINDDFSSSENKRLKALFEERILKELEKRLTTDH